MLVRSIIAASVASLLLASGAQAQDTSATATYGSIRLGSAFSGDPRSVNLTAGGNIDASHLGSGCRGSIARAPDYELTYDAGSLPLYIYVNSSSDTTLVVNGPNGQWSCDDDSDGNSNPVLYWSNPPSGTYDIWVGTYGGGTASATLNISELGSANSGSGSGGGGSGGSPNTSLTATYGEVYLENGFMPDPHRVSLTAGGTISASSVSSECSGSIATAPDYQITYTAGARPLAIRTQAGTDTTLLVNGPDGQWYCDDDSGGGTNAQVYFAKPQSGTYDIWVGTYGGGHQPATLLITEVP